MSTSDHLQSLRESKSNYKQRYARKGSRPTAALQHAMDWFILKWSQLLTTRGSGFEYGTSFGPWEKQVWTLGTFSDTLELLLLCPFSLQLKARGTAVLYRPASSSQEVVWGAPGDMRLASAWCRVELQAETETFSATALRAATALPPRNLHSKTSSAMQVCFGCHYSC